VSYVEDIWFSKIMEENQFRFRKDNPFCAWRAFCSNGLDLLLDAVGGGESRLLRSNTWWQRDFPLRPRNSTKKVKFS
jgi:hypothetical protein